MEIAAFIIAMLAIVLTAMAFVLTWRWRRRALDAELANAIASESNRHEVCMYRHMVRTLGGTLPHDPVYDGREGKD